MMLPVATSIGRQVVLYGHDGMLPDKHGYLPKADRFKQLEEKIAEALAQSYLLLSCDHYF